MNRLLPIISSLAVVALASGCAHRQLAFAHSRDEVTGPPRETGLGAWVARSDQGIELGASCNLGDFKERVACHVGKGQESKLAKVTNVLARVSGLATLGGFQAAVSQDGVRTLAKEAGPTILQVHTAPDALAVSVSPDL